MAFSSLFGGATTFNAAKDMPSLAGKVVLVTGGNSGLGKQSVLDLARYGKPAVVWLAARKLERGQQAADDIAAQLPAGSTPAATIIKALDLDLASFASVRAAAKRVVAESARLDILLLNAGIMATTAALTADGYEDQFGTNHMGHALLTKLLTPLLLQTAATTPNPDVRVVVVSSDGHAMAPPPGILFDSLKSTQAAELNTVARYGQSKLANILFARELARRFPGQLRAAAVHPGLVSTNLAHNLSARYLAIRLLVLPVANALLTVSTETGARSQLWAATAPAAHVESGLYYVPVGKKGGKKHARGEDDELAAKLWEWTEKELEGQEI
ncbi:short-chain dehydrogenase/reductase [Lasiosphaeria miniovina]|uniref:Short-chain dehydrogenase/reductase n=1 Tax=Lasiosphaeria miniovina TaxID=1954250 RepID=A0AA40ACB2_9PEZI|nr:short-chain dehydrogenase/reductase [Lasiosphaeria miniovina]KAK0713231.1 short-chain dehydrogenase/reductase [Lasiosphaeria miniovina]